MNGKIKMVALYGFITLLCTFFSLNNSTMYLLREHDKNYIMIRVVISILPFNGIGVEISYLSLILGEEAYLSCFSK